MAKMVKYPGFVGMNNVQDAARLKKPTRDNPFLEAADLVNVDVTDTFSVRRRVGMSKVYTGTPDSVWSNGREMYFVEGGCLKRFWPASKTASIVRVLAAPSLPMSYCQINYVTVCSNGVDLFLIENGVASDFQFSSKTFKEEVVAGHVLSLFNRRLYIGVGNVLYFTDADEVERLDERDDPFVFNSRITMIRPLENGMYVSAEETFWLAGAGPDEFIMKSAHELPALEGTDVAGDNQLIGSDQMPGRFAMWTTEDGICLGLDNGIVQDLTSDRVSFTSKGRGMAAIVKSSGLNQYIVLL